MDEFLAVAYARAALYCGSGLDLCGAAGTRVRQQFRLNAFGWPVCFFFAVYGYVRFADSHDRPDRADDEPGNQFGPSHIRGARYNPAGCQSRRSGAA